MKQKIAVIIPGGIGGGYFMQGIPALEDYINRISESFDVTVYSMIKTDPGYKPTNFKVHHTNASYTHYAFWKIFLLIILFIKGHLANKYKLVHGIWGFPSGSLAVVFGKIFGIPSVVSLQGAEAAYVPEIGYGHMYNPGKRKVNLWTCKHADALTVLTNFQLKQLQIFGFTRTDTYVIPYGADEKLFTRNNKTWGPPFNFIHIANLNEVKDQATLLQAFSLILKKTDSLLRIVGDGPYMEKLKSLTRQLGIEEKVEFTGPVPHKQMIPHLHWAHVMLHTSLSEGQAVVIAEAAACGVVVCGTKVGLIDDWGADKCISVDCGDYRALADQTTDLLNNPGKYDTLQTNASQWASEHTATHTADSFQKLYTQLLS